MYKAEDLTLHVTKDGTPTLVTKDLKYCTQALGGEPKKTEDFHYWYLIRSDNRTVLLPCRTSYDYVFSCESGKETAAKKLNELLTP